MILDTNSVDSEYDKFIGQKTIYKAQFEAFKRRILKEIKDDSLKQYAVKKLNRLTKVFEKTEVHTFLPKPVISKSNKTAKLSIAQTKKKKKKKKGRGKILESRFFGDSLGKRPQNPKKIRKNKAKSSNKSFNPENHITTKYSLRTVKK